jgi:hypothetical protein
MNITLFHPQSPANAGHQKYQYAYYVTKQYIPASKFTPCQGDREVHKKREKQMSEYAQSLGISITNQCYDCMQLDYKCMNCEETQEARDSEIAHDIVDDGNNQYARPLSWLRDEPSSHDWTEKDGEFKPPIVQLVDGGTYEELWEMEDATQRARETECIWCHILTPKIFPDCQVCDKPLESNVR